MKIYFVGSISGRKKFLDNYLKIISIFENQGNKVFEVTTSKDEEDVYSLDDFGKVDQYKRVLDWINKSDVMVAECSHSSLGVGYEISLALEKGKPVLVLYSEGNAPHFLEGIESEKLEIVKYDMKNLKDILNDSLKYLAEQQDVRFNFFVSPKIVNYLDWISKERKMPRAVYLRRLIEKDMEKNKDFNG